MAFVSWSEARQYLAWCGGRVRWGASHAYSLIWCDEPVWWLPFASGFVVYQWSPASKELTLWRTWRVEFFGNLSHEQQRRMIAMTLRKVSILRTEKKEISDAQALKRWPDLWEHLLLRSYPDDPNSTRQTSTITLFSRDDGSLGATLNDRDNARACFASADTVMGLLDALQAAVSHPATSWREDRQQTGGSKRKK